MNAPPTTVVCFDPLELEALLAALREERRVEVPGSRFPLVEGALDGERIGVLRVPFGDNEPLLRAVARGAIAVARPGALIAVGTAMACADGLAAGDVVAGTLARRHGDSVAFGDWLAADAVKAAPHDLRVVLGQSITADRFVASAAERERLLAGFPGADIIEMEDFVLATAALDAGVPFASLRVVTDRGDFGEHMTRRGAAAARAVRLLRRTLRLRRMARRLSSVDNPPTRQLAYDLLVREPGGQMTIPRAVAVARWAIAALGLPAAVPRGSRLELVIAPPAALTALIASPTGSARVVGQAGRWHLVSDAASAFTLVLISGGIAPGEELAAGGVERSLRQAQPVSVELLGPEPRYRAIPEPAAFHIQGLNSISAEPEEGLLAATTVDEFVDSGLRVTDSGSANVWVYRSANTSGQSYFELDHEVPMRHAAGVPAGAYLIATGLGPAIDPGAAGGAQAGTLVLGDEQAGRLVQYLDDLGGGAISAADVFRHEGVIQRLGPDAVALSRADRRLILTPEGMNSLRYNPATLRQVYSQEYDRFLEGYFSSRRRPRAAKASHLLMTSRGCGYHCSFCCSGGMQPFAPLGHDAFVSLLLDIRRREALAPGEHIDVYLTDSYFNRNPERVIQLAQRLEDEGLLADFEFFVRHNGLQAFLARRAESGQPPAVNERLIEAYWRLGIDELVIGVDAYTDSSIRMLKTNFNQVVLKGSEARPVYTFADIQAVLEAIERRGLKSRCFLLVYNPFVSDEDRLEMFYNLLHLALKLPNFRVDTDSSDRVNELKPFPGAPLTAVAGHVPGLIRGDRFEYETHLGRIEDLLDLGMFGSRRTGHQEWVTFLRALQAARLRVGEMLATALDEGDAPVRSGAPSTNGEGSRRIAAATAAGVFVREELRLLPAMAEAAAELPQLRSAERRLAEVSRGLESASLRSGVDGASAERRFFELLRREEVRAMLGHPAGGGEA